MTNDTYDSLCVKFPDRVWKTPDSYHGFNPVGHFCVATKNRDSKLLERHNFTSANTRLEPYNSDDVEQEERSVYVWRASHWGVGWVEYLMIRPEASPLIQEEVLKIINDLEEYPILNEDAYHTEALEISEEWWGGLSEDEQLDEISSEHLDDTPFCERVNYIIDEYKQAL